MECFHVLRFARTIGPERLEAASTYVPEVNLSEFQPFFLPGCRRRNNHYSIKTGIGHIITQFAARLVARSLDQRRCDRGKRQAWRGAHRAGPYRKAKPRNAAAQPRPAALSRMCICAVSIEAQTRMQSRGDDGGIDALGADRGLQQLSGMAERRPRHHRKRHRADGAAGPGMNAGARRQRHRRRQGPRECSRAGTNA